MYFQFTCILIPHDLSAYWANIVRIVCAFRPPNLPVPDTSNEFRN